MVILALSSVAFNHVDGTLSSLPADFNEAIKKSFNIDYNQTVYNSRVGLGFTIGASSLLVLYEAVLIILRFINASFTGKDVKVFLSVVSGDSFSSLFHLFSYSEYLR